jgi:hypothetical protein
VSGKIAGVKVCGIIDILDAEGRIIDIKTASRKPSKISGDHASSRPMRPCSPIR